MALQHWYPVTALGRQPSCFRYDVTVFFKFECISMNFLRNSLRTPRELIAKTKAERARLLRMVEAIDVFLAEVEAFAEQHGVEKEKERVEVAPLIERIANQSNRPITKSEMRSRLEAAGVNGAGVGTYFYVAVARLKESGRITMLGDGCLWKAKRNGRAGA
jgi:hypothetical protein